ncbi:hypothetical protein TNCV_512711 [Trichonephila clavipes]|nr:hypothetical protein TNCV_512711 [Trichonephila clavipes]
METKMDNSLHGLLNTICNNKAEVDEIAKFLLEEIVLRHGAPFITDRGAVFRSRLVSSLVDLCNIDHRFTNGVSSPKQMD